MVYFDRRLKKSMYPAIIIIIACTQTGQEGYYTSPDDSGELNLTTVHITVGENTADISLPSTSSTSDRGKTCSEVTPLTSR
jgi:hypothetical protein